MSIENIKTQIMLLINNQNICKTGKTLLTEWSEYRSLLKRGRPVCNNTN